MHVTTGTPLQLGHAYASLIARPAERPWSFCTRKHFIGMNDRQGCSELLLTAGLAAWVALTVHLCQTSQVPPVRLGTEPTGPAQQVGPLGTAPAAGVNKSGVQQASQRLAAPGQTTVA